MKIQSDNKTRIVSLTNLEAMCEYVSSSCHKYTVSKVTRSRVHVEYSNPSEYGTPRPIYAVFPCIPGNTKDDKDNPRIVLDFLNVLEGNDLSFNGEGWQSFVCLQDCPIMFRDHDGHWKAYSINPDPKSSRPYIAIDAKCICGQTVYQHGGDGTNPPGKCQGFIDDEHQHGCGCTHFVEAI